MAFLEFLYGFILPFQDLPRLQLGGTEIRLAFLAAPVFFIYALIRRRDQILSTLREFREIFIALAIFTIYLSLHLVFVFHNGRALGFFLWFLINAFCLFYVVISPKEKISVGFLAALAFGVFHILAQRVNPYLGVDPAKILAVVDNNLHYRVFSYFGEPSYASLFLLYFLIVSSLSTKLLPQLKFFHWCVYPALIAIALTFSKLGLLGIAIFYLLRLLKDFKCKTGIRRWIKEPIFAMLAFVSVQLLFPATYHSAEVPVLELENNPMAVQQLKETEIKEKAEHQIYFNQRRASFRRGNWVILDHPFVGIGLGNSKSFIETHRVLRFEGVYEGIHHLYQEILVEIGILGLALFSFFLLTAYRKFGSSLAFLPFWFTLLIPMQFCQNINMPAIWLGLYCSIFFWKGLHEKPE